MNTIELLGEEKTFKDIVEHTITKFEDSEIDTIEGYAFYGCNSLTSVSFPKAKRINQYAFYKCNKLTEVSFPVVSAIGHYAFQGCSSLTEVAFPSATGIGMDTFRDCSNLTSVSFPTVISTGMDTFLGCSKLIKVSFPLTTDIGMYTFSGCSSLTSVFIPEAKSIGDSAFKDCKSLTEVSFPNATTIGRSAFYNCKNLTTIYVGTNTSTVCKLSDTRAFNNCPNLTNIYVPESLVDKYKSATNWSSFASKIKVDIQPVECIALSITADDVIGNKTSTTIYYTAECTYTENGILQENTRVFTGKVTSDSFEQNTSTTDTVKRTVSFTFLDKTATTTITQGVWMDKAILVTTKGISDYGWVTADDTYNVDRYDVYMSNTQGVDNSNAVMKLECIGYTNLTLYIRSYAESDYDYTIASNANVSTYPTAYNSSDTKAHTKGNQNSGTTLSDYTAVTYTGLKDNDIIYIVFRKDSSGADGDDRGYVLIPKQA